MAESVMIIVLNAMAARTIFRTNIYIYGSDRITLLSLCFYDALMGVYLGGISIKSYMLPGTYCAYDSVWRTGWSCKLLGFLFTFSTHGSLLMTALISVLHCFKQVS